MSVKLNASTSSGLVVDSDLTGSLKLQTAGNDALTVDSSQVVNFTKQFQIAGVLPPAFSASMTSNQAISNGVATKVQLNAEDFDTANCFDSSTNYRFTPNVAGYYQLNLSLIIYSSSTQITSTSVQLYKNGSLYNYSQSYSSAVVVDSGTVSTLVYANGTTDYFEMYGTANGSNLFISGDTPTRTSMFSGFLVRAA